MIFREDNLESATRALERAGLAESLKRGGNVLIKINMARPPTPDHPRTDCRLLLHVIRCVHAHGGTCTLAEAANGRFAENLKVSGVYRDLNDIGTRVLDLDEVDTEKVQVGGMTHFLPTCLRQFDIRLAIG